MAHGKVLRDLLHVFGVEEGVVAGFVWRTGRGERRGRSKERIHLGPRGHVMHFVGFTPWQRRTEHTRRMPTFSPPPASLW